jgi:hypothetical protein
MSTDANSKAKTETAALARTATPATTNPTRVKLSVGSGESASEGNVAGTPATAAKTAVELYRELGREACIEACRDAGVPVPVSGALAGQIAIHLMTQPELLGRTG